MPQKSRTLIQPDAFYHIYNRGINRQTIFRDEDDLAKFLFYLEKYLEPAGLVCAYALLYDHFHLLVYTYPAKNLAPFMLKNEHVLGRTFGHLQNAYAKYFAHKYGTVSGLFERSYERILVESDDYFRTLVLYLHRNPIKHGICDDLYAYPWTSHPDLRNPYADTFLAREIVMAKFGGFAAFIAAHDALDEKLMGLDFEFPPS